tara:strand:- start:1825 stop:2001 length:177 start_codon:yes stop_codon:yes gene_type:complete
MEYDFISKAQPILTIEQFKKLQEIHGIKLSQTDLFLTYNKYITHARKVKKAYKNKEHV